MLNVSRRQRVVGVGLVGFWSEMAPEPVPGARSTPQDEGSGEFRTDN